LAFLTWMPPPLRLVVGRRDPPVLLSLLLSAAVRPGHVGKITLLNMLERHLSGPAGYHFAALALVKFSGDYIGLAA
jgi:hypothetical protein